MIIAHAGHWAFGLLEATPLLVVVAFALWRSRDDRPGAGPGVARAP